MFHKIIFSAFVILTCVMTADAYAGKMELTTYYPAPSGEYDKLQSKGSCVGTACTDTDVTNDNLRIKQTSAGTGGSLTVDKDATISGTATITTANISTLTGTTTISGTTTVSNTGNFVIQKRTSAPTAPAEGQIWIQ